jgi:hypothetical protein
VAGKYIAPAISAASGGERKSTSPHPTPSSLVSLSREASQLGTNNSSAATVKLAIGKMYRNGIRRIAKQAACCTY